AVMDAGEAAVCAIAYAGHAVSMQTSTFAHWAGLSLFQMASRLASDNPYASPDSHFHDSVASALNAPSIRYAGVLGFMRYTTSVTANLTKDRSWDTGAIFEKQAEWASIICEEIKELIPSKNKEIFTQFVHDINAVHVDLARSSDNRTGFFLGFSHNKWLKKDGK
ncbi:MAG TPA: hypothetical protein VJK54_03545, partial [Chthoniobacterales bacterium]|nr:hypothetical protein [Chthoniobacterales bacterium]